MKIFFGRNYLVINDECYGIQLLTTGLSPLQTGMTFFHLWHTKEYVLRNSSIKWSLYLMLKPVLRWFKLHGTE